MNKYFFFDRKTLQPQGMDNVRLKVAEVEKDTANNPLFTEDFFADPPRRWEQRIDNGYPNVIYDPKYKKYRCYYTLCSRDPNSALTPKAERVGKRYLPSPFRIASLGYAESDDGVHWTKPNLGFTEFEGSRENNLLFHFAHGTGVFLDIEEADPARRYKLITKMAYPGGVSFMAVNFSGDGIHWGKMLRWPKGRPRADTHNFPFRDKTDGLFKVITRSLKDGVRVASICTSADFINWSEPREVFRGGGFESQIYSMPVFRYENLYLGLPSVFCEGDRSAEDFDTVSCELAFASAADRFDRAAPGQHIIGRGKGSYPDGEFDSGCIFASAPIDMGDRLCIYYMGGNGRHTDFRETSLGRGFLKKDRFAWYEQREPGRPAVIFTGLFSVCGDYLSVLAEGGEWSAAICPSWREEPYEGFGFEDCVKTPEADGYVRVSFGNKKLTDLEKSGISVAIHFQGSRIYALKGELICRAESCYEGSPPA